MADNFLAPQVLDAFDSRAGHEPVVPIVLRLRKIDEPLLTARPLPVGLVMQAADKIDFSGEHELGAVRHRRGLGVADDGELELEAVFFHHPRFFENRKQREMRCVAGEKFQSLQHEIPFPVSMFLS